MNTHLAGALLPMWLLGAPLLLAIVELFRTPRPSPDDVRRARTAAADAAAR